MTFTVPVWLPRQVRESRYAGTLKRFWTSLQARCEKEWLGAALEDIRR